MSGADEFSSIVAGLDLGQDARRHGRVLLRGSEIELDLHTVERRALVMTIQTAIAITASGAFRVTPEQLYRTATGEVGEVAHVAVPVGDPTGSMITDLELLTDAVRGSAISLLDAPALCRALSQLRHILSSVDHDTARAVSQLAGGLLSGLLEACG